VDLSHLVEKVSKSVVAVTTRRVEWPGDVGLGTAFAVDRGVYVTAYHVVASGGVALVTPEGEWSEAEVVAADPAEDLALLYSDLSAPPLPMGSVLRLKVGQGVVAVGFPLALLDKLITTFGIVSAVGGGVAEGGGPLFRISDPDRRGDQTRQLGGASGGYVRRRRGGLLGGDRRGPGGRLRRAHRPG
jgi:serine protease Do